MAHTRTVCPSPSPSTLEKLFRLYSTWWAEVSMEPEHADQLMPFTAWLREIDAGVSAREYHAALATYRGLGQLLTDLLFATYDVNPADEFARMTKFVRRPVSDHTTNVGPPHLVRRSTRTRSRNPAREMHHCTRQEPG
ncbi:hypothetical protein OH768_53245 [Streptomyces sp. NBC_01622]|uniref:hypothetical protein n=1 Tax=Streptomyces sp. NBC_01622 TaxID=2975903 RepID=UPI0038649013|nr:hypothetical protein OH768_53245 [Streptomyces sp. NBC_01622]